MKTINNEVIRSFSPCYDPTKYVKDEVETLSAIEWVSKYRGAVPDKDIIWLLLRRHFYTPKDLQLFAVWCAREALKLVANPDPRSIEAVNVAERYANGEATDKELNAAYTAAADAANVADAANAAATRAAANAVAANAASAASAASAAAWAASNAAKAAAWAADAREATRKQLDYLLSTFTML